MWHCHILPAKLSVSAGGFPLTINFIPNDPNAQDDQPMRKQPARSDRPTSRASFNFEDHQAEGLFDFGTLDFLFWQSREAALAAVEAWETVAGNLTSWANRSGNPKRIDLSPVFNDGQTFGAQRLNAYYDGQGVRFFDFNNGQETIFSGSSTDTVSHEVGHALLDAVRPELFQSNLPEVPAFHEAMGDCVAVLTALADPDTRKKLLQISPDLSKPNFVEAGSEYLSAAIRKQFGNVAPSRPRRALNTFKWQLPSALPAGAFQDPPELLSREPHSFSRVFTGCFYDGSDEAALAAAAVTAGKLLVAAVRATPETARYFQGIGRAMVKADEQQNGGAHRELIGKAFADHGIMLGSAAMTAATAGLAGPPPKVQKTIATISPATLSDLRERMRTKKGARFEVRPMHMLGAGIAECLHRREVPLGKLSNRLRGVVAYGAEPVLVGASGPRAALLGALPESTRTEDEVSAFVGTLLACDRIAFDGKKAPKSASASRKRPRLVGAMAAAEHEPKTPEPYTHVIRTVGGKKVLTRLRFLCGCCPS
jgi:hypothetical protein